MKKIFCLFISFFLLSFDSNNHTGLINVQSPPKLNVLKYQLGEVSVKWTAFKHSNKAEVGGEFNFVSVNNFKPKDNIITCVEGVSFSIPTNTTNTNDKIRDNKIINSFFYVMNNTDFITGTINSLSDNGSGALTIKMNNQQVERKFTWEFNEANNAFFLKTSINVLDWGADNALAKLNEVCLEKHTGNNGINKLWPTVDIIVIADIKTIY